MASVSEESKPDGGSHLVQHLKQLPPDAPVVRHVAIAGRVPVEAAGPVSAAELAERILLAPERGRGRTAGRQYSAGDPSGDAILVYSNELSRSILMPPSVLPTARLADDITTTAAAGCLLDRYVTRVTGDGDQDGKTFSDFHTTVGLYDACPGAGGVLIPGTECVFQSLSGPDVQELTCVIPDDVEIPLPTSFYVGVSFSRRDPGVIVGALPTLGISADRVDFPGFPCTAGFGGYPPNPHASFYFQAYVRPPCARQFPAYKATNQAGAHYTGGPNVYFADDIHLAVPDCNLTACEVGIKGTGAIIIDLRTQLINADPINGGLIPGTRFASAHEVGSAPRIVRKEFDPPIRLPQQGLFIVFRTNTFAVGPVFAGKQATVGFTDDFYCRHDGQEWICGNLESNKWDAFEVALYCEGQPPMGACCDMMGTDQDGESVCRVLPEMNCSAPGVNRWIEDTACEPDPFEPACGLAACCTPDDICENLTKNQCRSLVDPETTILWNRGDFCETGESICPWFRCIQKEGACLLSHNEPGCREPFCCTDVCDADPWCCRVEWDRYCVEEAGDLCSFHPRNDDCEDVFEEPAALLAPNSTTTVATFTASRRATDPIFPCRAGDTEPDFRHTMWFAFEATHTTARVGTCGLDGPGSDSLIRVFRVTDPDGPPEERCDHLEPIACNDAWIGCDTGLMSEICVGSLIPGQLYYIMLATVVPEDEAGIYQLELEAPCPAPCVTGDVEFIDPPNGVIDARDTIGVRNGGVLRGIDSLLVRAPAGSDHAYCWSLCETDRPAAMSSNTVAGVVDHGDGYLTLQLSRALSPWAVTYITYTSTEGPAVTGRFTTHAGNVNGNGQASALDVLSEVDVLNGVAQAPWGTYGSDCDFSGQTRPQDILCLIDLLSVAGSAPLPPDEGCK